MITIPSALLFAMLAVGGAGLQAREHATIIRRGMMTAAVKRNWTTARGVVLGLCAMGAWALGVPFLSAAALFVGAWCLHTAAFRWWLNAAMGWDRYYLGSTSRYDLLMISLVLFAKNWRWPNVTGIQATHQGAYKFDGYRADVHRAGRLAYAVELIVSASCSIFAVLAAGVP